MLGCKMRSVNNNTAVSHIQVDVVNWMGRKGSLLSYNFLKRNTKDVDVEEEAEAKGPWE